ncbi:MAG TPA: DUF6262 family protein [Acidobacteriota bacterium]|nr:DUF6262 family protein [Acidobacteriota bacterium]HNH82938.1 DUF6262 family protein [Acidobacteriota bacterium]HNJ41192.1 DUF6262 family protein [Acidobacteriota bacterium]
MTHKRNVEGIRLNAKRKHQEALTRADEAIRLLVNEKRPVNFKSVAETAGISIPFLYQNQALKERIIHLRSQTTTRVQLKVKAHPSDASKDAMIEALQLRAKEAEAENRSLKKQLEVVYGQLLHQGTPEQPAGGDPVSSVSATATNLQHLLNQANSEKNELAVINQQLKQQNHEGQEKLLVLNEREREVEILKRQNQSLINEIILLKSGQPGASPPVTKPRPKGRTKSAK